jgi:hypothetical protein
MSQSSKACFQTLNADPIRLLRSGRYIMSLSISATLTKSSRPSSRVGRHQGSQVSLEDFDQLVEGSWPISTSCLPGDLWGRASLVQVHFGGKIGRTAPLFGPKISISRSKTLPQFPNFWAFGPGISTRRQACEPWPTCLPLSTAQQQTLLSCIKSPLSSFDGRLPQMATLSSGQQLDCC